MKTAVFKQMLLTVRTPAMVLIAVFVSIFAGCSRNTEGSNFTHVEAQDPGMNAAIAKGKASAEDFVRAFHSQKPGTKNYYVNGPQGTGSLPQRSRI